MGHGECVETQEISIDELDIGAVDLVGGPGEVNRIPPEDLRLRLWEFTIDDFYFLDWRYFSGTLRLSGQMSEMLNKNQRF